MQPDIDNKDCNVYQCNNDEVTVLNNGKIIVYQIQKYFGECGIPLFTSKYLFLFLVHTQISGLHT